MKKQLLIISIIVVIVIIFVSCSVNNSGVSDGASPIPTTAVTDSDGATHYYEPVTDDNGNISTTARNQGVFAEIETKPNGKVVTEKNGKYVTNEHITALPIENTTDNSSGTTQPATEHSSSDTVTVIGDADNDIEFETPSEDTTTEKTTTTTTETTTKKDIQPATDKDGWITKWY